MYEAEYRVALANAGFPEFRVLLFQQSRGLDQSGEPGLEYNADMGLGMLNALFLGDVAADIQTGKLLTMHAAWLIDQGDKAQKEVSMAKVHVADTLHKAADTAIQLNGARGYSKDTVLEWIYRYARQARLVDGASEGHKMVLARNLMAQGTDFWAWG